MSGNPCPLHSRISCATRSGRAAVRGFSGKCQSAPESLGPPHPVGKGGAMAGRPFRASRRCAFSRRECEVRVLGVMGCVNPTSDASGPTDSPVAGPSGRSRAAPEARRTAKLGPRGPDVVRTIRHPLFGSVVAFFPRPEPMTVGLRGMTGGSQFSRDRLVGCRSNSGSEVHT